MQADLGGAFYEMAIRDHVRLDVLTRKAAELQRVDAELLAVERVLELERADAAGLCPGCGAPFGHAGPLLQPVWEPAGADRGCQVKLLGRPVQRAMAARRDPQPASASACSSPPRWSPPRLIVATAMTSSSGLGPLAGLLGRSLAANRIRPPPRRRRARKRAAPSSRAHASPAPASSSAAPAPAPEPIPAPEAPPCPPNPRTAAEHPRKTPTPEAGRIKHVSSSRWPAPAMKPPSGRARRCPNLAGTLRSQGRAPERLHAADGAALTQLDRRRQAASRRTGRLPRPTAPSYDEFHRHRRPVSSSGVVAGQRLRVSVTTLTPGRPARQRPFSLARLPGGHGRRKGATGQLRAPGIRRRRSARPSARLLGRLKPFAYFHSLLDLGDCSSNDVPLTELDKDLKKADSAPSFSYISPNLCDAGVQRPVPAGSAGKEPPAADAFLTQLVPKLLASPAYKKDGLVIVSFGAANPVTTTDPTGANGERPGARAGQGRAP